MRIVTYKRIKEFSDKHADAENPLNFWYHTVRAKEWNNLNEINQTFNSVDYVGNNRYVFNIKRNHYRLNAIISFNAKKVYILFIGMHCDPASPAGGYDKINNIKNI